MTSIAADRGGNWSIVQFRARLAAWLASAATAGLLLPASSVLAQSAPVVSRAVVQGLPSAESQRLNAALARIGRDPRDYSALIDAGDAANAMGDPEAAAGFYKRADGVAPGNPRIKAGLARALVLQGKPADAIPLFAGAEAGGAAVDVTSDRGLAYDLVGDPVTAQRYYQAALARRDEDEVRRRLGVSLAITGDAAASDAMLMPLLRKQDKPAWRAHAFALAIAGKTKEAVDTVNAILPVPLAQSVTPYLRYMPRLTRAQQAAAVNLGKFPRASEIGRDDPAIAAYTPSTTQVAAVGAGLIPRGKPLGSGRSRAGLTPDTAAPLSSSERRARDKAARLARAEAVQAARVAPPDPMPTIARSGDGELPALATSTPMPPAATMAAPISRTVPPAVASSARTSVAPPTQREPAPVSRPVLAEARPTGAAIVRKGSIPLPGSAATTPAPTPSPTASVPTPTAVVARPAPAQTAPIRTATPGFDLATLGASSQPASTPSAQAPPVAGAGVQPAVTGGAGAVSLEQAFADLGAPSRAPAPIAGAVDVRAIEPVKAEAASELANAQASKPELARADKGKLEGGKPRAGKPVPAHLDDSDEPAVEKKRGVTAKEAKLADAKLADAKLADGKKGDAKKADAKKGDAKKFEAKKPAPPSHPSRIWVQVGVGRDKAAIGYDWRKFVKENPALFKSRQPYISDMGRTNRILAGPFESQKAAADLLAKLKKADFGSAFVWTSPAGQVVDPLTGK